MGTKSIFLRLFFVALKSIFTVFIGCFAWCRCRDFFCLLFFITVFVSVQCGPVQWHCRFLFTTFSKSCLTFRILFSCRFLKTVLRYCGTSFELILLQIYFCAWQWKNFENGLLMQDEVTVLRCLVYCSLWTTLYIFV